MATARGDGGGGGGRGGGVGSGGGGDAAVEEDAALLCLAAPLASLLLHQTAGFKSLSVSEKETAMETEKATQKVTSASVRSCSIHVHTVHEPIPCSSSVTSRRTPHMSDKL